MSREVFRALFSMVRGAELPGFFRVVRGMDMMAMRDVRVMPCARMVAPLVMIGRFTMVLGRVLVMLSGLAVMLCSGVPRGPRTNW